MLVAVFIISSLVAAAVGIPLVENVLQIDRWLPLAGALDRVIGYTFTVGIVSETLKYVVVRYAVWPVQYRVRLDSMAYAVAAALGYATVLNLHFVLTLRPSPDIVALRTFATVALHIVTTAVVGYGLSENRFGQPFPLFQAAALFVAALLMGLAIPFRAGLVNAGFALAVSTTNPLLGLVFSAGVLLGVMLVLAFLLGPALPLLLALPLGPAFLLELALPLVLA